ncbi:galactokinase [Lactobacillus crispatus]|jgi:galactokinase|uniref:Galactokinase n=3 Tax=Lactobacillus crispatus TaxID=47770 RepID=A0A109DEK5_9LACO|nr:galactokinase [Lactobacillus crispatus]STX18161.1 Galactokinase [Lactobacillus acidophilus]EEJ69036.1 galactokinase [Lactobacillus crispatus JV-V01]EEU28175.1 galactokinase [Lactobacillus crispatus MV-1A-US]EEX29741.1 galactokinase [Lactobacillus crispatus MV-3A-US]EFE00504.1 galactokinase [Lactobacillus crispatus 214-1]
MNKEELLKEYETTFGEKGKDVFFSPGRINVIGEHTDYNGGHVFPAAISLGVYGVYGPREDKKVCLFSGNVDGDIVEFDIDDTTVEKDDRFWANYFKGMITYLREKYDNIDHGFNLYIKANLPSGSGLSSSAAIEMLMGIILKDEFNLDVDRIALAKMGQRTENEFVGLNSGIMDQFACIMGKKDSAIFLDCNTLDYEYKPLALGDYEIIIMATNKPHTLADSAYNDRVRECHDAVKKLQAKLDIKTLGELDNDTFDEYAYLINNETEIKRARHAVSENQRTLRATKAMQDGDLEKLGRLIDASHVSLHYDYEVTGQELDTLAEASWAQPGVLGARMIGGGFGGSAIAIVKKDQAEAFKKNVGKIYRDKIGYDASFYDAEIVDGTKRI